jgi:hypothetical protein
VQTIVRTKENIVKKQALTYDEMEAEREEVCCLRLRLFLRLESVFAKI